ncbi:hypothetical protein BCR32DRAFT_290955 [Anaeromyces robustus]|uniref:Uncharacterized protein n=1 Tax=Anaeromyces robustus TaxID=1754192 RepID=A0A1Y1XGW2_9FUNG|nr:hypothetical protein BCR32DRAFT_290955 [Anaeromyces robustus]|eukprot:ORX84999.1 hypothetical protein BCR32DRAFT_290955 [Anaeromyces robustus]
MLEFVLKWFRKPIKEPEPETFIDSFLDEPFFDNSTEHFLDIIRVIVVITVQQFIFILISKFILNKIWKKRERSLILSVFCIWGMSSSLCLIFWFPISIFFQYFFVQQWIISYFSCLWRWMFYNSMVSLYGLMPAAYFISETETMVGTLNKFKEVTTVLVLLYSLVIGLVYIFQSYFALHINTVRLFFGIINAIPTIICSWVCIIAIPCGITSIFKKIKSIPVSINHNQEITNQLDEIRFEYDRFSVQLQQMTIHEEKLIKEQEQLDMNLTNPQNIKRRKECIREIRELKEEKETLEKNIEDLLKNKSKLKRQLGSSPFLRLILFIITFVSTTFIYLGLFARISWRAIEGLDDFIGVSEGISNAVKSIFNLIGLSDARMVKFHMMNLLGIIQTKKVFSFFIYLFLAYWFLIFLLSRVSDRTAFSRILGNIFPVLIFASVVPIIVRTLGIQSNKFQMLNQLIYTCLIIFLMVAILLGFYEYLFPKLLPKKNNKTSTTVIITNVMLLIIISYTTLYFVKEVNIYDIDPKIVHHFLGFFSHSTYYTRLYYTLYRIIVANGLKRNNMLINGILFINNVENMKITYDDDTNDMIINKVNNNNHLFSYILV